MAVAEGKGAGSHLPTAPTTYSPSEAKAATMLSPSAAHSLSSSPSHFLLRSIILFTALRSAFVELLTSTMHVAILLCGIGDSGSACPWNRFGHLAMISPDDDVKP